MNFKLLLIIISSISLGAIGGYSYSIICSSYSSPSPVDMQVASFSASYGTLRNLKEKNESEASPLLYALMNNSLKEMYKLYPEASQNEKQMILISFKGYEDYIINNPLYSQTNYEVNELVRSFVKKHNKSLNLTEPPPK